MVDGVVYVGSDDDYLYALAADTGRLLWRFETGDDINSSPAVKNGVIYIGSNDDYLYAVDTPAIGFGGIGRAIMSNPHPQWQRVLSTRARKTATSTR